MPSAQPTPAPRLAWISRAIVGVRASLRALLSHMGRRWRSLSLAKQFATCATLVLLPAMLTIGTWVSNQIEHGVTHNAGVSAALYMENFVEPLVQDLAIQDGIRPSNADKIARLLTDTSLGQKVISFKIWGVGGRIIAASRPELVGQSFPMTKGLVAAWSGIASTEFDHLKDAENVHERATGLALLEVYIPLRARGSDQIIAVGEFYEKAPELKAELNKARLMSWLVVGAVTLSMLAALFAIVRRGSQTIVRQQSVLEQRVTELTGLLAENGRLRSRIHRASARASEGNEQFLRRLGADLHDGPAQLISLALLRLDDVQQHTQPTAQGPHATPTAEASNSVCVRTVLSNALLEIRNIATGLAVPEIEALSLKAALTSAVHRHEELTRTRVDFSGDCLEKPVPPAVKLCAYRVLQEGLTNAFRHADGQGQVVRARLDAAHLELVVSDSGRSNARAPTSVRRGLGLRGLTDRIESLGGSLLMTPNSQGGTSLTARLPLSQGATHDE